MLAGNMGCSQVVYVGFRLQVACCVLCDEQPRNDGPQNPLATGFFHGDDGWHRDRAARTAIMLTLCFVRSAWLQQPSHSMFEFV